jgi:hypothetical protein
MSKRQHEISRQNTNARFPLLVKMPADIDSKNFDCKLCSNMMLIADGSVILTSFLSETNNIRMAFFHLSATIA